MPKIVFGTSEMQPMSPCSDDESLHDNQECGPRGENVVSDIETADMDKCESHCDDVKYENEICVISTNIVAITKLQLTSGSSPRYMFVVELKWSDGHMSYIARDHDDFFRYHCWLLDNFPDEAGHAKSARQIPLLPGLLMIYITFNSLTWVVFFMSYDIVNLIYLKYELASGSYAIYALLSEYLSTYFQTVKGITVHFKIKDRQS